MNARGERPAPPQTREIIGRDKERQATMEAIRGTASCVLHLVGEAGIGKTRQLREVARWNADQKEGSSPVGQPFEWLGLLDLYHSDLHTPGLVEEEIVRRIDPDFESNPEGSPFRPYLEKRELFEERRRQGLVREKERAEVTQTFVTDYNRWAAGRRAVIAFDTLELIVYEQDEVFEAGEGSAAGSADVKGWLLEVLPQLENSVILLASRPHEQLEADLKQCFSWAGVCYQLFELKPLSEEDALEYLQDIIAQRPDMIERLEDSGREPTDIYRDIWRYTQGVPILMGLVVDLHAFGGHALAELKAVGDTIGEKKVRKLLIHELCKVQRDTLRCLAVARKGLTPELLQRLMAADNWTQDRCRAELERLSGAVFIKSREDSAALFLHDAIYDMFDEFQPFPPAEPPSRLLPQIIEYYREQVRDCDEILGQRQASLSELEKREQAGMATPRDYVRREALRQDVTNWERERQRLWVEMLFYRLWHDVREGFELYAREYNEALKAHNFGYDARLHDEMLRFLKSGLYSKDQQAQEQLPLSRFNRHCGLRWVKFHLARTDYQRAARVARRILEAGEAPLGGPEAQADRFYQAELRLWLGEALLYLGQVQEAENWLKESLDILRRTPGRRPYAWWRRSRLVGRAHNDLGYIYRGSQRYRDSVLEYRKAIARFRGAKVRDEHADTLNNLAFVYSVLGDTTGAKALAEDACQLREQLGQAYLLALSYNTMGLIHTAAGEPEQGKDWCEKARKIFDQVEDERGRGLACIGLGKANRKRGDKGKRGQYSFAYAQTAFEEAAGWLEKALAIFDGDPPVVEEPLRRWEALNELGSTYTDWAYLLAWHGLHKQADEMYRLSVKYQEQAAQVAQARVAQDASFELQLLDSYDDLAYAYAAWGQPAEAEEYLHRIEAVVPQAYRLVEGKGFAKLPNAVDGYWLVLGKYYLQRAIWASKAAEPGQPPQDKDRLLDESARHFALAMAYFQRFSPEQFYVGVTRDTMYQYFRTHKSPRLERLRREIRKVARQYRVNLARLLDTLDDAAGSPL